MENTKQKIKKRSIRALAAAVFFLALGPLTLGQGGALAKVERVSMKSPERKVEQKLARQNLRNIDLKRIEDPEARKAIREILRYLKLNAKQEKASSSKRQGPRA